MSKEIEPTGPGQHATAPKYRRNRRSGEMKMARAAKQEKRRGPKGEREPEPEVLLDPTSRGETGKQRFDRIIHEAMTLVQARWAARGKKKTPGQIREHEARLRIHYRRSLTATPRRATKKPPMSRGHKHRRRMIAKQSRARNRAVKKR